MDILYGVNCNKEVLCFSIYRSQSFSTFTSKIRTSDSPTSISSRGNLSSNIFPLTYFPNSLISYPMMDSRNSDYVSMLANFQNLLAGNRFSSTDNFLPNILDNFLIRISIVSLDPKLIEKTLNYYNPSYLILFDHAK